MDESDAWLRQAISDWSAAERFYSPSNSTEWCHAIAKYQQTVEKAVKAIVVAYLKTAVGYKHEIKEFVRALVRYPRGVRNTDIPNQLSRLFDQSTRDTIDSLEAVIPKRPLQGEPHRRNTEYPFQDSHNQWTFPASDAIFSKEEVDRYRELAHQIANAAQKIIPSVRRTPR